MLRSVTQPTSGTAAVRINFRIDGAAGELVSLGGALDYALKDDANGLRDSGAKSFPRGPRVELPGDVTGAWGLTLDFAQSGPTYTGTATVQTSTGATTQLTGNGVYSATKDTTDFLLTEDGGRLAMVIATSGTNTTLDSVKGKLFGQTLNYRAP
jgi:hypothetical protein